MNDVYHPVNNTVVMLYRYLKCKVVVRLILLLFFLFNVVLTFSQNLVLVENNRSDYVIVIPEKANKYEKEAAEVLADYLERICGTRLMVQKESAEPQKSEIVVGRCKNEEHVIPGFNADTLKEDGFFLKTSDKRLFITGGNEKGSLYGVYTFLENYLGCRKYCAGETLVPKMSSIVLEPVHDLQIPVFTFRDTYYHEANDPEYTDWHKLDHNRSGNHPDWGSWVHTFSELIPSAKYFDDHPEYFSLRNGIRQEIGQLCLTNESLTKEVIKNLKTKIDNKPKPLYWSVSQNDNTLYCQCEKCHEIDSIEGSHAGSVISFVNQVADAFPEKIISTLAYQYSRKPPAKTKPRDNVNIMLCSIECNRSIPISEDINSADFVEDVSGWRKTTDNILLWDYITQFTNLVSPFPNFHVLQPNIQLFANQGVGMIFEQGNREKGGEFAGLRSYIVSKLLWDPTLNVDSLMKDFLGGYYGPAWEKIYEYIDQMTLALEKSGEKLNIFGHPYDAVEGYLSPGMIRKYNRIFDEAEKKAGASRKYYNRVLQARLPLQYAMLEIAKWYGSDKNGVFEKAGRDHWLVKTDVITLLDTFVNRSTRAGIERLSEWGVSPVQYRAAYHDYMDKSMEPHLARKAEISFLTAPDSGYLARNPGVLTDGLRGTTDWHYHWLGYRGNDMEIMIDLGKEVTLREFSCGFLHNHHSWIFLPSSVAVEVFNEQNQSVFLQSIKTGKPLNSPYIFIEEYQSDLKGIKGRYIKCVADNIETCPQWHKGYGGKSWIFIDEVIVR